MEYLKLIQPTHDTTGKRQYHDKLMRGVSKVKDLLDVVNMGPHQSIIKGLPTNKLGEPRVRQTKVHRNNLVVNDIVTGQSSPASVQFPSQIENYRAKLRMNDERVSWLLSTNLSTYFSLRLLSSSTNSPCQVPEICFGEVCVTAMYYRVARTYQGLL